MISYLIYFQLFVGIRDDVELFLSISECSTVLNWKLCRSSLTHNQFEDCSFQKTTASARVPRRLCVITGMAHRVEPCNGSSIFARQQLHKVTGNLLSIYLNKLKKLNLWLTALKGIILISETSAINWQMAA